MGDPAPEKGAGEGSEGHLAAPHVLGYASLGWGRYSAQQQGVDARTYALRPISSSVPNSSASRLRMHDPCRWWGCGSCSGCPGLLTVRTPVIAAHAVIGKSSVATFTSASASVLLSVSQSVSEVSASRRSDSRSTTSTTSSGSASEDVDIDIDIDIDVVGKGVQYNYLRDNRDAFQANNGVYGASAAGYALLDGTRTNKRALALKILDGGRKIGRTHRNVQTS
jgi:hypothetical protein